MDLLPPSILPVLQTLVGKQFRIREQGVEIVVGRHRSCCLEMGILPLVTVMIAPSSRAWRWLRIRSSTRVILWAMRTSGSRISPVWGLPWRWMSSPKSLSMVMRILFSETARSRTMLGRHLAVNPLPAAWLNSRSSTTLTWPIKGDEMA